MVARVGGLVAAIVAVLLFAVPLAPASANPANAAATVYTYNAHHIATGSCAATKHGPRPIGDQDPTYDTSDRRPHDPCARSGLCHGPAAYAYNYAAPSVQVARSPGMAEDGARATERRSAVISPAGVAANTESRVLRDVEHLPCNCFVAGTKVKTAGGEKLIEDVQVGDRIWARDLATGKNESPWVSCLSVPLASECRPG